MRPRYKVSQAGVDLIETFEGFRAKAARLDDGCWTIGYGHTRSAREGAEVSREDALILLQWVDLPPVEQAINALVSVALTQNQYDALVAFVFNIGVDAFGESEVLQHLTEGRLTEAACALELWRKADIAGDPVVLDALIRRRAAEKALFLASGGSVAPTPSPLVRPRPDARAAQFVPARRPAEIEAPLGGDRAEVRLVAPYEVEPEPEAPTVLAPEPVEPEQAVDSAPEEAPPTAWTAVAVEAEAVETPEEAVAPVAAPTAEPAPEAEAAPEGEAGPGAALTAPAAWVAEIAEVTAAPESAVAPETAPTAWTVNTLEQQAPETAEQALTAWTAEAVEEAEPEPSPTAWVVEEAELLSTAWSIELPHTASVTPEAPAPIAWTAEPAESDWPETDRPETDRPETDRSETDLDEPAPSSWIVGVTGPAAPASEPAPAAAESAAEPAAEAAADAEAPAVAEAAPVEAPEPEAIVRDVPAVGAVLQTRALPQSSPRPRPLYSSYGPMAFALAPPARTVAETTPAAAGEGAATAAPPPAQPQLSQPQPSQPQPFQVQPSQARAFQGRPHFQPLAELSAAALEPVQPVQNFAPPVPAESQAQATAPASASSAPAVTADAGPAKPLVLTSPPADWEEPRAASTHASLAAESLAAESLAAESLAAEADELETPLFDEGWDGPGALSGRIVHHEAPAEHDARATKLSVTGPYVLLGFIGFVAFGGALFAFSRGHAANGGAGNPVVLAWILALIGAACVGISVYFLLKRLGGQED